MQESQFEKEHDILESHQYREDGSPLERQLRSVMRKRKKRPP
jgi:hypothetical protein